MSETSSKILEGVFAVNKPQSLSSAQVLRDLQNKFAKSKTFAPLLEETRLRQQNEQKRRRHADADNVFKMGHGGTLDPLATGILIVGIGKGTKHLNNFLGCTKTYETVVLFGKSTDTYDIAGKIVAEAPYQHITKEIVRGELAKFCGKIKQVPPSYSALKINGMKAYEYARSGKELPRELESRDMTVEECSLVEWYEGGKHDFRWPAEEASEEDKTAARKLMDGLHRPQSGETPETTKAESGIGTVRQDLAVVAHELDADSKTAKENKNNMSLEAKAALHTHLLPTQESSPSPAPAARIRLTVSSGFYVRSFAHDLGIACNSFGIMSELVRSRQAEFSTIEPLKEGLQPSLTYEELEDEEVWGLKIAGVLETWMSQHPDPAATQQVHDRARLGTRNSSNAGRIWQRSSKPGGKRKWGDRSKDNRSSRLRNSSSPD